MLSLARRRVFLTLSVSLTRALFRLRVTTCPPSFPSLPLLSGWSSTLHLDCLDTPLASEIVYFVSRLPPTWSHTSRKAALYLSDTPSSGSVAVSCHQFALLMPIVGSPRFPIEIPPLGALWKPLSHDLDLENDGIHNQARQVCRCRRCE